MDNPPASSGTSQELTMISFRTMTTVSILGILATLAGCSGQATTANTDSTSAQQQGVTAVAQNQNARRGHEHLRGGQQAFLLGAALHENIGLTDAQKSTIEKSIADLKTQEGPRPDMRADMQGRMTSLASQVRAGKIDVTTNAQLPAMTTERDTRIAASAKALDTLHATLTADQRKALVAAVEAKGQAKGEKGGEHEGRGRGFEHGKAGERGPMGGLLGDLQLTQAQKDQIEAKLQADKPSDADREAMKAKFQAMHQEMKTKLESFASDNFDATAFVAPPADVAQKPREDRMAKNLAVVVSVLDASQREKLAQKLEQGPQRHEVQQGE